MIKKQGWEKGVLNEVEREVLVPVLWLTDLERIPSSAGPQKGLKQTGSSLPG